MSSDRRRARDIARRALVRAADAMAGRGHHVLQTPDRVYLDIEQPTAAQNMPRWGHGKPAHAGLLALLRPRHDDFMRLIDTIGGYGGDLAAISRDPAETSEPTWSNPYFSGLDAASLYCFLRERQPARYVEIGSGNSTRFAARAKRDGELATEIVSIDPQPRAEVDALCDRTIRARLEQAELDVFGELGAGDVLLFDGSHRVFMNNDVTTFFLDVLPQLHPEVLIGVHDIDLPEDYHPDNAAFYWTEQYMLAMALLAAGPERARPVLPCRYVCTEPSLKAYYDRTWDEAGLTGLNGYGSTFWFESSIGATGRAHT